MSYYGPKDDLTFIPLTIEEEKNLFAAFYAGEETVKFRDRPPTPPRDIIVQHHLKLVIKLSLTFSKGALPDDDAISAGNFGMIQALESRCFDTSRGFRFASYVRAYVRGQVLASLKQRGWKSRDTADTTIHPEDAVITGQSADPTTSYRNGNNRSIYLDGDGSVDHGYEESQLNEVRLAMITEKLKELPALEALTIRRVDLEGLTYADVGRERKVSREAARKAHIRGILKLKSLLENLRPELA